MASWGAPMGVRTGNSVHVFGVSPQPWRSTLRRACLDHIPLLESEDNHCRSNRVIREAFRRMTMNGKVGEGLEAMEGVRDWLTDVEKEMAISGPCTRLSHTHRSLIALDPDAVDQSAGPRRVVVRTSADLSKHASQGWLEVNLTRMDLDEVRSLARHLQSAARNTLYTLKMKVVDPQRLHPARSAAPAAISVSRTLKSPEVQSAMACALGSLLETTTQLNILEMNVDPGMSIMKSLSQGLALNNTLRCLSFKGAAIGDELFEELARGLVRNTSLQVLLVQGCELTDKAIHWVNIMLKHHSVQASTKGWEDNLRRYPGDEDDLAVQRLQDRHQAGIGLVKIDLSNNRLTYRGIQVLSCTLRMMENRLKYLGLRNNNLGRTTCALLRDLVHQTPCLQIVDLRYNQDPAVDVLTSPVHKACAIHHSRSMRGGAGRRAQIVSFSTTDAVPVAHPPSKLHPTPEASCVDKQSDQSLVALHVEPACLPDVDLSEASAKVTPDQPRSEDPSPSQCNDGFLHAPRQDCLSRAHGPDGGTVDHSASTACLNEGLQKGAHDARHASKNLHQDEVLRIAQRPPEVGDSVASLWQASPSVPRVSAQTEASMVVGIPEISESVTSAANDCLARNMGEAGRMVNTGVYAARKKLPVETQRRCLAGEFVSSGLEAELSKLATDLRHLERMVDGMESTSMQTASGGVGRGSAFSPPYKQDDLEGVAGTVAHQLRRLYNLQ